MRLVFKTAALVLGAISIAAATYGPVEPFVTGTVYDTGRVLGRSIAGSGGVLGNSRELSETQLQKLYSWFNAHKSNLHMILASPPPPSGSVLLFDRTGGQTQLDLYSLNESWRHAIQIKTWDGQGKFLYGGEMSLPSADMTALREMLRPPA